MSALFLGFLMYTVYEWVCGGLLKTDVSDHERSSSHIYILSRRQRHSEKWRIENITRPFYYSSVVHIQGWKMKLNFETCPFFKSKERWPAHHCNIPHRTISSSSSSSVKSFLQIGHIKEIFFFLEILSKKYCNGIDAHAISRNRAFHSHFLGVGPSCRL